MAHLLKLALFGCLLVLWAPESGAGEWPQWRGPTRDGLATGAAWPPDFADGRLKRVWRVEQGPSYSGPIVAGDRVFTTATVDKRMEVVGAHHRDTGERLWETSWEGAISVPFFAKANGDWIRSTPAWDGERLYVGGIRDVLVCLDGATGQIVWRHDFVQEHKTPPPAFGFVCSPLVDGERIYAQAGASIACLDKRSGRVLWRALEDQGGMWGSAFSSPVIAEIAGKRQLVALRREGLAAVDPDTGEVLWTQKVEAFRGMNILTPVVFGSSLLTSTYGGRTILHRLDNEGGTFKTTPAWEQKSQGYMSSPVIIGGHAYHHLRSQRMTCIDLGTGEEKWTTSESFGKYCSLVANGDRILALDERGLLFLIQASPEKYIKLDSKRVAERDTWAHLAVVDGELYIRELNALARWDWK